MSDTELKDTSPEQRKDSKKRKYDESSEKKSPKNETTTNVNYENLGTEYDEGEDEHKQLTTSSNVALPIEEGSRAPSEHAYEVLNGNIESKETPLMVELKALKEQINNNDIPSEEFAICMNKGWKLLSEHAREVGFQLRYYHQSAIVRSTFELIMHELFKVVYHASEASTGNGGNWLLTGPLGVGKSGMLLATHTLCRVFLTKQVICFMCDYSEDRLHELPHEIISREIKAEFNSIDEAISHSPKCIVFLADELQTLYIKDEKSEKGKLYRKIINEIASLGKSFRHMGVCTGSSVNTRQYAYYPLDYNFEGYSTLNISVYQEIRLKPVKSEFKFFVNFY